MQNIYLGCLIGGVVFALITILFGDLFDIIFDGFFEFLSFDHVDFLHPIVFVGGITIFGGSGLLLSRHTILPSHIAALYAILISLCSSALLFFLYVKPMKNCENSIGYSQQDLVGKSGEILVPIGEKGYGEVLIRLGTSVTNQIAASSTGKQLATGTLVKVCEVKDGIVFVVPTEKVTNNFYKGGNQSC